MFALFCHLKHRSFCLALLAIVGSQACGVFCNAAMAAGCNYHSPSSAASDLPHGVVRIYEYGQFYFYHPVQTPCSGPSCDGSKPNGFQAPVITQLNDQRDSSVLRQSFMAGNDQPWQTQPAALPNLYQSLRGDELLRPPCAS